MIKSDLESTDNTCHNQIINTAPQPNEAPGFWEWDTIPAQFTRSNTGMATTAVAAADYKEHTVVTKFPLVQDDNPKKFYNWFETYGERASYYCWSYLVNTEQQTWEYPYNAGGTAIDRAMPPICQLNNLGFDILNYNMRPTLTNNWNTTGTSTDFVSDLDFNQPNITVLGNIDHNADAGVYLFRLYDQITLNTEERKSSTPLKLVIKGQAPTSTTGGIISGTTYNAVVGTETVIIPSFDWTSFFSDADTANGDMRIRFRLENGEGVPDWVRVTPLGGTNFEVKLIPQKISALKIYVDAMDETESIATATFDIAIDNDILIINEVQEDQCIYMNVNQQNYIHTFTTAFTDPDDNNIEPSIEVPNDATNPFFDGAAEGYWLLAHAPATPNTETTTKVTIKGGDSFGVDLEQFVLFTTITRSYTAQTVSQFRYVIGSGPQNIQLTDYTDYSLVHESTATDPTLPSFMIPRLDLATRQQFLEVDTANYTHAGKYYITAKISKYECYEEVQFAIIVDTPPIVDIGMWSADDPQPVPIPAPPYPPFFVSQPQIVTIYNDIKTKVDLDEIALYDIDGHAISEIKHYQYNAGAMSPELFLDSGNFGGNNADPEIDFDFDPLENVFYIYYNSAATPAPTQIPMVTQAVDIYDVYTYWYWVLDIQLNNPPVADPAILPVTHTVFSGDPFSFTHSATLFSDPDGPPNAALPAGNDYISSIYMTWGGDPLPDWILYNPITQNYAGVAPTVGALTTYLFNIWAYDARGKAASYSITL